jgi:hypothetical protein
MPPFMRTDTSQSNKWHSVFQSAKAMLVTSFEILDFQRCAQEGFLGSPLSNTKPREWPILPSCWHVSKLWERPSYPRLLQQLKPGPIILSQRQKKALHGMTTPSISLKEKIVPVSRQGYNHCLLGLCRSDSCGCDAKRKDNKL